MKMDEPKKIILITIDALRQDSLGCYGNKKPVSPFLDCMAQQGTKFNNVYATGPYSAASFPSILASVYPLQYEDYIPLPKQTTIISELLGRKGYKCSAFHSSVYMSRYYGYNRGFDFFQDYFAYEEINKIKKSTKERIIELLQKNKPLFALLEKVYSIIKLSYRSEKKIKTSKSAETVTEDVMSWIGNNIDDNLFVWIHYMDTHIPYYSSKKHYNHFCPGISRNEAYRLDLKMRRAIHHKAELNSEEIAKIKCLYEAAISYVDENIERLVDFLKKNNIYEETLVIITADHGEEFNEHGDVCHKSKAYDINLKVPFILSKKIDIDCDKMISLIDIPSTLACLAGAEKPKDWKGINFINELREGVYFENYNTKDRWVLDEFAKDHKKYFFRGVRTRNFKYVADDLAGEMLFDVNSDPEENENLSANNEYLPVKNRLKKMLENIQRQNLNIVDAEKEKAKSASAKEKELIREGIKKLGPLLPELKP